MDCSSDDYIEYLIPTRKLRIGKRLSLSRGIFCPLGENLKKNKYYLAKDSKMCMRRSGMGGRGGRDGRGGRGGRGPVDAVEL